VSHPDVSGSFVCCLILVDKLLLGHKIVQQKTFDSGIIIDIMLRYSKRQKHLGTRKLLEEMQDFFVNK